MRIHFGQVYIEPGVDFPFSHHFQRRLAQEVSALVEPSRMFLQRYGNDFKMVFNISAKQAIVENELRGPTVFKKTKSVEYTIFLPFDVITQCSDVPRAALKFLLNGTCAVLETMSICTDKIVEMQDLLIDQICSDPAMFEITR